MTRIILSFLISLFICEKAASQTNQSLHGELTTFTLACADSGEILPFADLVFYRDGQILGGSQTDIQGRFIGSVHEESDTIELRYLGQKTKRLPKQEILKKLNEPRKTNENQTDGKASIDDKIIYLEKEEYKMETIEILAYKVPDITICTWRCVGEIRNESESSSDSLGLHREQKNISTKINYSFYPNPSLDVIFFIDNGFDSVQLFDARGKLINSLGPNLGSLNISDLPAGPYFIQFNHGSEKHVERLIKQ